MTAFHSDLFPSTFLQKLYYGFDIHPAVLASSVWIGYRLLSPIHVGDVLFGPPVHSHNVLVKRRRGAASGGASLLAERTLTFCYVSRLRSSNFIAANFDRASALFSVLFLLHQSENSSAFMAIFTTL